jgi:hypothetical protein
MRDDVAQAMKAPDDAELVFNSEQVPLLYLMSLVGSVVGLVALAYYFLIPAPVPLSDHLLPVVGVAFIFCGWLVYRTTRAGYPRLTLQHNRLALHGGYGRETVLDLGKLGRAEVVHVLTRRQNRIYLGFRRRADDDALLARGVVKPLEWTELHKAILLNGLVATDKAHAQQVADVVNARRGPAPTGTPPVPASKSQRNRNIAIALCLVGVVVLLIVLRQLI